MARKPDAGSGFALLGALGTILLIALILALHHNGGHP